MMIDKSSGWIGDTDNDPNPWVQVDLGDPYTIVGFYLLSHQQYYLTSYNIKVSVDGSDFAYIKENIATDFSNNELSNTYWFTSPAVGRYWKIEVVSYYEKAFVKGDFFGYVWVVLRKSY